MAGNTTSPSHSWAKPKSQSENLLELQLQKKEIGPSPEQSLLQEEKACAQAEGEDQGTVTVSSRLRKGSFWRAEGGECGAGLEGDASLDGSSMAILRGSSVTLTLQKFVLLSQRSGTPCPEQ